MRAADLFCGVGGISCGLAASGIKVAAAYDCWGAAVDVYRRNLHHRAGRLDLNDVAGAVRRLRAVRVDLVAGGPPCQDFSSAGRRVEGARADLTRAFAEIVAEARPGFVLMENVAAAGGSRAYMSAKAVLARGGYSHVEVALDASRCGVPQRRRRLFLFAWAGAGRAGERFLDRVHGAQTGQPLTVRGYMGDELGVQHYFRPPTNYGCRGIFGVDEPAPTIRGMNRPKPANYRRHPSDSADPAGIRSLSCRERGRIQTFPAGWEWPTPDPALGVTKRDVDMMVGNAVPPQLARFVGEAVAHAAG